MFSGNSSSIFQSWHYETVGSQLVAGCLYWFLNYIKWSFATYLFQIWILCWKTEDRCRLNQPVLNKNRCSFFSLSFFCQFVIVLISCMLTDAMLWGQTLTCWQPAERSFTVVWRSIMHGNPRTRNKMMTGAIWGLLNVSLTMVSKGYCVLLLHNSTKCAVVVYTFE